MRAPWSRVTRRTVTLGGVAVASAAFATVAVAAGPVIYSEYTTSDGGGRENRVVEGDGTNDAPFAKDASAATVSPDGRRIAVVAVREVPGPGGEASDDSGLHSELRVTAADGSSPVVVVSHDIAPGTASRGRIVVGRPVWSPDGTQVLIEDYDLTARDASTSDRLLCTVATRRCRTVGRRTYQGSVFDSSDLMSTDVVAWPAGAGPLRAAAPRASVPARPDARCGAPATRTPGPVRRVAGLYRPNTFGPTLRLRGMPLVGDDLQPIVPGTADLVGVRDGVVALDAPGARARQGRVRCTRRSRGWALSASLGLPRLSVRRAGTSATLPTPAGLRRGDLAQLVATDDGGAVLVTRGVAPARRATVECPRRGRSTLRCASYPSAENADEDATKERRTRVWRYRPGGSSFVPVTGLRRSALATLRDAADLAQGPGDALLAADGNGIDRVPLDGGAPTAIVRGRDVRLGIDGSALSGSSD